MIEARNFYENQLQGIGSYFWDSVLADIESLKLYGGIHQKHFGLYRFLCRRFPYAVYYEVVDKVVFVIAVLPMKRDTKFLLKQIKRRQ